MLLERYIFIYIWKIKPWFEKDIKFNDSFRWTIELLSKNNNIPCCLQLFSCERSLIRTVWSVIVVKIASNTIFSLSSQINNSLCNRIVKWHNSNYVLVFIFVLHSVAIILALRQLLCSDFRLYGFNWKPLVFLLCVFYWNNCVQNRIMIIGVPYTRAHWKKNWVMDWSNIPASIN